MGEMNWVDFLIIAFLLLFTLDGLGKSFIAEGLNFFSLLLSLVLSLRFYNNPALWYETVFSLPHSLSNVLGFATVWFLVELFLSALFYFFYLPSQLSNRIDRALSQLSWLPAFMRGLIFVSIILVILGTFPIQPVVKAEIARSRVGTYILDRTRQLELPLKNIFGGITQDTLTFLTIEPQTNQSVNLGFRTQNFISRADLESQMIDLVNRERLDRGLAGLSYDPRLQIIAREHSADMFRRGYFSHYSPEGKSVVQRAEKVGVNYLVIGENLAYAPDLLSAHRGLMNSPGHRANILSADYHKIGVGIMDGGVYGLMITQVFTN